VRDRPGPRGSVLSDRLGPDVNGRAGRGCGTHRTQSDHRYRTHPDPARLPDPHRDSAGDAVMRAQGALAATALLVAACAGGPPETQPVPVSAPLAARLTDAVRVLDSAIAAGAAPGAVL